MFTLSLLRGGDASTDL